MRKLAVHLLVLLLVPTAGAADEATKSVKLQELMRLQGLYEMIEQQQAYGETQAREVAPRMFEQIRQQFPDGNDAILRAIEDATERFVESAKADWTVAEAVDLWAEYYGSGITKKELDAILVYYNSPIGRKDVEAAQIAMPKWNGYLAARNNKVLETAMNAYVAEIRRLVSEHSAAGKDAP